MPKTQRAFTPRMARKKKPTNQGGPVQFRNRAGPIAMIAPTDTKTTGMIHNIIFRLGGKYNLYATGSSKKCVLSTSRSSPYPKFIGNGEISDKAFLRFTSHHFGFCGTFCPYRICPPRSFPVKETIPLESAVRAEN